MSNDPMKQDPEAISLRAPMTATVIEVAAVIGQSVAAGATLVVLEAMKMHHPVVAPSGGSVVSVLVGVGDTVSVDQDLVTLALDDSLASEAAETDADRSDPARIRADLAALVERRAALLDSARPEAVARRHDRGRRTTRENLADLCDPGSFVEYGGLVVAAQRRRRSTEDLIAHTPADGLVTGVATVNAPTFGPEASSCVVMAYDYTVLAGTQGQFNHHKKDRMLEIARRDRVPVITFAEGGGGRPGDTDGLGVAGLDCWAFRAFAELSGNVPLVGITTGYCFAGNAALLGMCDVVIATKDSNIGMGGPAMIEGGGLGVVAPDEIGPAPVQVANGVIDVLVADEAEAVAVARTYLGYAQGPLSTWQEGDQWQARHLVPEDRRRAYDVRAVIELVTDTGSVLELRRGFGTSMITALARLEGRAIGVIANDPMHLGGAIDVDAADKAARPIH